MSFVCVCGCNAVAFLCLYFSFAQHAVISLHVACFIGVLSPQSSFFHMRQTSGSRLCLCVGDIFHWAALWDAYQDIFCESVWHIGARLWTVLS